MTTDVATTAMLIEPGANADEDSIGAKAAALWRLHDHGFAVPRLAVITTTAYRTTIARNPTLQYLHADPDASAAAVDELFLAAEIDPPLRAAIVAAVEHVTEPGSPVVVRSSATAEDLGGASFAGQYRSVLDVVGAEAAERAVRLVWASLWHPNARAYRRELGIDIEPAMAVIIMEQLQPRHSGVAFGSDPAGDRSQIRIEAVTGLADRLVAGALTPVVHHIGRHEVESGTGPKGLTGEVADLTVRAERLFGRPLDIEWACDDDGLKIVQARPITAGADDDEPLRDPTARYATVGIAEMLPGPIAPLIWDTAGLAVDEAIMALAVELGASGKIWPLVERFRTQAVLRVDMFDDLTAVTAIDSAMNAASPSETTSRRHRWRRVRHEIRSARVRARALNDGAVFVETVAAIVRRTTLDDQRHGLDDAVLLRRRGRLVDLLVRGTTAEIAIAAAAVGAHHRLEGFLRRYLGDDAPATVNEITRIHQPVGLEHWRALARFAMSWPVGRAALRRCEWTDAEQMLTLDGIEAHRFLGARDLAARVAGSRAIAGGATWQEQPQAVWEAVRAALEHGNLESVEPHDRELLARLAATGRWRRRRALTGVLIDTQTILLRRYIDDATELLGWRERLKTSMLSLGGEIRRTHLEIGRRLVDRSVIERIEDIDLLWAVELAAALERRGPPPVELHRRRRHLDQHRHTVIPEHFTGRPEPFAETADTDTLIGWSASGGRYEGIARVLDSPDDELRSGEILVALTTDPSWSPLFMRAGALVIERGGPLSHAAIVARELGVPAVVNVEGITRRVHDGDRLLVDASGGRVTVLHDRCDRGAAPR